MTATPGPGPRQRVPWARGLNPWLLDGALAAAFVVIGLVTTAGRGDVPPADYRARDAFSVLLVLAASVPFAARRRAPLAVLLTAATAVSLLVALGYNQGFTPYFLFVAAFTVGAAGPARQVAVAATAIGLALVLLVAVDSPVFDAENLVGNAALFAAMFVAGANLRIRQARVAALEERAAAVEREKREEARRAVADERLDIARELHDVVAHSMGVIAVQASMGEHVIDAEPEQARSALHAISGVSRSALTEIRRMLAVLRDSSDGGGAAPPLGSTAYAPAPGLDQLSRLVHDVEGAGVPVSVSFDGPRVELPRGVDLTAYRILQEGLTNVLRHAGPARAWVTVRYEPGAVVVEVVDDGRGVDGRAQAGPGGGNGLVGMRERVAVYGGTLDAGPNPGGGFRVAARLPYGGPA
ncbi:MAG: sensor histidine kinase [Acidimicrobiia bacterium]|nr:sensor histidine kinase [Acidimicrobiia bacterium]MCL4293043.1 sensor histidine kinase [Acidimicrobiia bacterium]